jgi:hypothetical protein
MKKGNPGLQEFDEECGYSTTLRGATKFRDLLQCRGRKVSGCHSRPIGEFQHVTVTHLCHIAIFKIRSPQRLHRLDYIEVIPHSFDEREQVCYFEGLLMPFLLNREASVVGFMPKISAAPPGP